MDLRSVMFAARPIAGPHPEIPLPATPMPVPYFPSISLAVDSAASLIQVDAHDVRAILDESMRCLLADAAAGADDDDNLPGEFLFRWHALQLRFLEEPILDVERLLLRQCDVFVDCLSAAHHFHGTVVELRCHTRLGFVLAPGDHAETRNENDRRVWVAHRGRVRVLAAFVVAA